MGLDLEAVRGVVGRALEEDLGRPGDLTSSVLFERPRKATAQIVARGELVLAGLPVAAEVFRARDADVELRALREEGERILAGQRVAVVRGDGKAILEGERTALNFLMRMSGIATAARAAVEEIAGTGATILDTRKTAPGLRLLDKYAVAVGGACNHRMGLYDAVMIKDTHLRLAGSIRAAVERVLAAGHAPEIVTVEVGSVAELSEAIEAGAGRALLDNMGRAELREAVRHARGRIVLEASGGLRPGRLREVAEAGVDFLSLGWLTHSAPAADLAMEMEPER
jgi:nicotinate-nucleotide pyrophosphorylase (carboxylating)